MTDALLETVGQTVETNLRKLIEVAELKAGQVLVIGTSTSEVLGHLIGTSGTLGLACIWPFNAVNI
jgi:uncharacterized protein YwlG (UPF0340 family)